MGEDFRVLSAIRRVHFALEPADMRKSYNGLLVLARKLGLDPYQGECVIFISKNGRLMKAVIGDSKGIFLLCRKFEGSSLRELRRSFLSGNSYQKITTSQMWLLFEGYTSQLTGEAKDWKGAPY